MQPSFLKPVGQGNPASFIREGFVRFTPAQAEYILRECTYDGQRRIDNVHVQTLRELMQRDLWSGKDKLDFARVGDQMILINGYHRLTAQAGSGRDIEWTVVIHDCPDMDAARALYFRFDTNIRSRTANNILEGVGFADRFGLPKNAAASLYKAAALLMTGLKPGQVGEMTVKDKVARRIVDDRLAICTTYAPAMAAFLDHIKEAPPGVRGRCIAAGFVAVAVLTVHHAPHSAKDFWIGLAKNDGLRRNDPRNVLLQDMLSRNRHVGPLAASMIQPAKAWNAFVDGRPLSLIRVKSGERVALRCTPYVLRA